MSILNDRDIYFQNLKVERVENADITEGARNTLVELYSD